MSEVFLLSSAICEVLVGIHLYNVLIEGDVQAEVIF